MTTRMYTDGGPSPRTLSRARAPLWGGQDGTEPAEHRGHAAPVQRRRQAASAPVLPGEPACGPSRPAAQAIPVLDLCHGRVGPLRVGPIQLQRVLAAQTVHGRHAAERAGEPRQRAHRRAGASPATTQRAFRRPRAGKRGAGRAEARLLMSVSDITRSSAAQHLRIRRPRPVSTRRIVSASWVQAECLVGSQRSGCESRNGHSRITLCDGMLGLGPTSALPRPAPHQNPGLRWS